MDLNKLKATRRRRRKFHIRKRLRGTTERPRLTVTRSLRHIYVQVIDDTRGATIASASSDHKDLRDQVGNDGGNKKGAVAVGAALAQKLKGMGVTKLCFDRNGYRYHGRVAALADAVRKEGIEV